MCGLVVSWEKFEKKKLNLIAFTACLLGKHGLGVTRWCWKLSLPNKMLIDRAQNLAANYGSYHQRVYVSM